MAERSTLPVEILVKIFYHLAGENVSNLANCFIVCKAWKEILDSNYLWGLLCENEFQYLSDENDQIMDKLNWKEMYKLRRNPKFINPWEKVPQATFFRMGCEMHCVCCCGDKIYFGSQFTKKLFYVENIAVAEFNEVCDTWEYGNVSCFAQYKDRFLAIGCSGKENNVLILDTKTNEIIKKFSHPLGDDTTEKSCTFQYLTISCVKWGNNGKYLFSASPQSGPGVCFWDVENENLIRSFDHRKAFPLDIEPGLYGTRDPHEIFGLCPSNSLNLLVHIDFYIFGILLLQD